MDDDLAATHQRLLQNTERDPDQLSNWEALITFCEGLEGGIGRNSSHWAIAAMRDAFDRLLARFPLMYGYWIKYANFEFNVSGIDSAELTYERGLASCHISVDLWIAYTDFKTTTTHDSEPCREIFERGLEAVGLDFLSGPYWDKYMAYERRTGNDERAFVILSRAATTPSHTYQRYYEEFRQQSQYYAPAVYLSAGLLSQFTAEVHSHMQSQNTNGASFDVLLQAQTDRHFNEVLTATHRATTERWNFESTIQRPYFNTPDLDEAEIRNWREYLHFEEQSGDHTRIKFLYERCLVSLANYEEFWLRYIRWMATNQPEKTEDLRILYKRAACLFMPTAKPTIRLQWALFEETQGSYDAAAGIYEGILMSYTGHYETIIAWANAARRVHGSTAALNVLREHLSQGSIETATKALLYAEFARILWKFGDDSGAARGVFIEIQMSYLDSLEFWKAFLCFEMEQSTGQQGTTEKHARVREVHANIRGRSHLSRDAIDSLSALYMQYLLESSNSDAAREYLALDASMNQQTPARPS